LSGRPPRGSWGVWERSGETAGLVRSGQGTLDNSYRHPPQHRYPDPCRGNTDRGKLQSDTPGSRLFDPLRAAVFSPRRVLLCAETEDRGWGDPVKRATSKIPPQARSRCNSGTVQKQYRHEKKPSSSNRKNLPRVSWDPESLVRRRQRRATLLWARAAVKLT